jgi:hypothetical protein
MLPEGPRSTPLETPQRSLGLLRTSVEAGINCVVERAKQEAHTLVYKDLLLEIKQLGRSHTIGNFDHYVLALGNISVQNKQLTTYPFLIVENIHGKHVPHMLEHQGASAYSLLRAGVSLSESQITVFEETDSRTHAIRSIGHTTPEAIAMMELSHISRFTGTIRGVDSEWITLLALEMIKRAQLVPLRGDGKTYVLADLHALNRRAFDSIYGPTNRISAEQKSNLMARQAVSCQGLHALHALLAYDIAQKNNQAITGHITFIYDQLKDYMAGSDKQNNALLKRIDFLSHLLTPLTELPANYSFSSEQKSILRRAIFRLSKDIMAYVKNYSQDRTDTPVGSLAHALDVLKHLPKEFYQ